MVDRKKKKRNKNKKSLKNELNHHLVNDWVRIYLDVRISAYNVSDSFGIMNRYESDVKSKLDIVLILQSNGDDVGSFTGWMSSVIYHNDIF